MTEDDFFTLLAPKAVPATEDGTESGRPIHPALTGMLLRPLDVEDMLAVHEYVSKNGKGSAFRMMFARSLRSHDGSRVLSDAAADRLGTDVIAGPVAAAIPVIRKISGQGDDGDDDEKKVSSASGPT